MKRVLAGLAVIALAVGGSLLHRKLTAIPVVAAKTNKMKHGVALVVERTWYLLDRKAFAYPETLMVSNYTAGKSEITFYYQNKKTQIHFKDTQFEGHQPDCESADNVENQICTLLVPGGLKKGETYKYTVSGEDDSGPLKDNDPFIEVDR